MVLVENSSRWTDFQAGNKKPLLGAFFSPFVFGEKKIPVWEKKYPSLPFFSLSVGEKNFPSREQKQLAVCHFCSAFSIVIDLIFHIRSISWERKSSNISRVSVINTKLLHHIVSVLPDKIHIFYFFSSARNFSII